MGQLLPPSSASEAQPKAADADLLGEPAPLKPPSADTPDTENEPRRVLPPEGAGLSTLPEPPPAEDENQPGFIGERNRPAT